MIMKKYFPLIMTGILSMTVLTGCDSNSVLNSEKAVTGQAIPISKPATLTNVLKTNDGHPWWATLFGLDVMDGYKAAEAVSSNAMSSSTIPTSNTNTQVAGVDEGDKVKVQGEYIYKIQDSGFIVAKANNGTANVVYQEHIDNYIPYEMYTKDALLVIIGGIYQEKETPFYDYSSSMVTIMPTKYYSLTAVNYRIYDVSDKTNIIKKNDVSIDGTYITSRLIDDQFYLITNDYISSNVETLPKITDNCEGGTAQPINLDDTYYYEGHTTRNLMSLHKLDLAGTTKMLTKSYLVGYGKDIYVSSNNIYASFVEYKTYSSAGGGAVSYNGENITHVQRYALETLENDLSIAVAGAIKDRHSMDEYNGVFRIATTNGSWSESSNGVYTFDNEGKLLDKIEGIAPKEIIHSVSFDGDLGYIVTFERTDPLYVIDLSNPSNLKITSELKKDGVSQYLKNYDDGKYLMGIGQNSNIDEFDRVTLKGVEVALYDISNPNETVMLDRYIDLDADYPEVLHEPKALLFSKEQNLFGFALNHNIWENDNRGGYKVANGFYIFQIIDDKLAVQVLKSGEWFIDYNTGSDNTSVYEDFEDNAVTRGIYIGDYLYTMSSRYITGYALSDFSQVAKVDVKA